MNKEIRYVFFGTPEFAATILKRLIAEGFPPIAVICNPDRPVGRKKILTAPPVKSLIANRESHIEILQPEQLASCTSHLASLSPDLFIVAAYAKIIPKEILAIPRLGTIGVHPSLLPKYRGTTPIQSAILNGDEETGTTLYLMDEKMDHGMILANRKALIANRTHQELHDKLAELSGNLLIETLPKFMKGEIVPTPQDKTRATYTKKFKTEDGFISTEDLASATEGRSPELAEKISRMIRALNPEPGVWTLRNGLRVKLLRAEIRENKLIITQLQEAGKLPREAK